MLLLLCSVAVLLLIGPAAAQSTDPDQVSSLPGLADDVCWNHFSGYLPASRDHKLFYWYHEATSDPESKPLVLWLNGGPGCSSLGGMFTELGPFVLDKDLSLTLNPFSFNRAANIIFIEQPVGVGFSHPLVPANDSSTAIDTDLALRAFLKKHPELQGRDTYVMGESYGGHYVPNTVKQIQISNAALPLGVKSKDAINIKGFAVGNGYTDWQLDFNANVENGRFHALTSQSLFDAAKEACGGDYARCFWPRDDVVCPKACHDAVQAATTDAMDGSIDIYDIYEDVCLEDGQARLHTQASILLGERRRQMDRHLSGRNMRATISPVFPTCIDDYSARYLNQNSTMAAIHVDPATVPNGKWADCSPTLDYDFNYESELPNYREWTAKGDLEILIYNGDADFILSHMGNAAWIDKGLNLTKSTEWSKWHGSDGQIAGYFERWKTGGTPLTFLTVKGAGHMVPRDRPRHALDMFEKFLSGGDYDKVAKAASTPLCARSQ